MSIDSPCHLSDLNLRNKEFWEEDQNVNTQIKRHFINAHAFQVINGTNFTTKLRKHLIEHKRNKNRYKLRYIDMISNYHLPIDIALSTADCYLQLLSIALTM